MASPDPPPQPDFITFLFSEKPKFDCHFIVGEKTLVKPERFGAVKMMLMAHSTVFRAELEDSELKEKGEIAIKDMYPDTFRALLKFIYGYDITGDLEFDEADNMFYAAEKYMMSNLKNRLAVRLITLLTPDNVCSLLNNPAISTQLQLKAHITQILRYETDKVLASPQFLEVCPEGFVSILVQDGLSVPEIELWRAAMKWAKHRANSEDGQALRQKLSGVSKHLRICTLTGDQFCQEVVPAGVLNCNEMQLVVESIGKKEKVEELTEFSNELEPRKRLQNNVILSRRKSAFVYQELKLTYHCEKYPSTCSEWTCTILTKQSAIGLLPLVCLAKERNRMDPEGWKYGIECTVKITKMRNRCSFSNGSPLTITFRKDVEYGKTFEIPLTDDGYNVMLPPNSKYLISVRVFGDLIGHKFEDSYIYESKHMLMSIPATSLGHSCFLSSCMRYTIEDDG